MASLVICSVIVLTCVLSGANLSPFYYIFIALVTFVVCAVVFFYAIEIFLYRKIKLIYKTINRLKVDKRKGVKIDMGSDVLAVVNQEVVSWAQTKSQEINKLKEIEVYRKEFIGNLSHELKTPIFNIQGYILTLLEGAMDDSDIATKFLEKASMSVERMTSLVEDLDALIKLETGGPNLKLRKYDIVSGTRELIDSLDYLAKKKGITLKLKGSSDTPILVYADKGKIEQVLTNLIVNSINYGNKGGKTTIDLHDMDTKIMIEVTDNGMGIDNELLPRIFERFYRVDKSRTRHEGGSGLGLAIVKHIIEAHNQRISVTSTVGEGTTFSFTLSKPPRGKKD